MRENPKKYAAGLVLQCLAIYPKMPVAKEIASFHVKLMQQFIKSEMKGWLDADLIGYYDDVLSHIQNF